MMSSLGRAHFRTALKDSRLMKDRPSKDMRDVQYGYLKMNCVVNKISVVYVDSLLELCSFMHCIIFYIF